MQRNVAIVMAGGKNAGGKVAVRAFGAAKRNREINPEHLHIPSIVPPRRTPIAGTIDKSHLDKRLPRVPQQFARMRSLHAETIRSKRGRRRGSQLREQFEANPRRSRMKSILRALALTGILGFGAAGALAQTRVFVGVGAPSLPPFHRAQASGTCGPRATTPAQSSSLAAGPIAASIAIVGLCVISIAMPIATSATTATPAAAGKPTG
jgi:hypothetical protein